MLASMSGGRWASVDEGATVSRQASVSAAIVYLSIFILPAGSLIVSKSQYNNAGSAFAVVSDEKGRCFWGHPVGLVCVLDAQKKRAVQVILHGPAKMVIRRTTPPGARRRLSAAPGASCGRG